MTGSVSVPGTGPGDRVVVVGGSLAGLNVAEALRAQGHTGPVTVLDADPEPRYDRPPLSKEYLGGTRDAAGTLLRPADRLAALDVDWRLGEAAVSLDTGRREVGLEGGRSLPYRHLVVATGVAPVQPPALRVPGALTLKAKDDADRLRARLAPGIRLVVIGAGFVGLEVAATFRAAGAEVRVVEAAPTPLHRQLGPDVGGALRRLHESHGVAFHLGTQADSVEAVGDGYRVRLADGSALTADVLLVAVGSAPAVGWLAGSGLELDNGVVCDAYLRASPDVFAIGDVARWHHPLLGRAVRVEHWTNAVEQAKYVAGRITGAAAARGPFDTIPYFWSDHYGVRVQAHGFPAADDDVEILDGDLTAGRFAALYRRAGRVTAVVGLNHPRQVLAGRRLLVGDLAAQGAVP